MVILFFIKACLVADPTFCITPSFPTGFQSEEQCQHAAPLMLPQLALELQSHNPDYQLKAWACAKIARSEDS